MVKEFAGSQQERVSFYLRSHLFQHTIKAIIFSIILAVLIIGYLYVRHFSYTSMHLWLIALAFILIAQLLIAILGQKNLHRSTPYFYLLIISNITLGITMGYFFWHYFPIMNLFHRMVLLLFFASITAGGTISMASSPLAFIGFILPVYSPIILQYLMEENTDSFITSLVILVYLLFLLMIFISNWRMLKDNLEMLVNQQELNKQLTQFNQRLSIMSTTDELTKLANRRYFQERLISDWIHAKRTQIPLSLLLIDLDYFKTCNDNYGHLYGDECLKAVSRSLNDMIKRRTDLAARFGGDELAVILYNTSEKEALSLAEQIKTKVRNLAILNEFSPISRYLTITIGGVSFTPQKDDDYILILSEADKALYEAKSKGRDCIVLHNQEDIEKGRNECPN